MTFKNVFGAITRRRFIAMFAAGLGRGVFAGEQSTKEPNDTHDPPWATSEPDASADIANIFGTWFTDRFGLPAFRYTLNQDTDARAGYETSHGISRDHWHQVGNDRVLATVHNDSHVQLWYGERHSVWLTQWAPAARRYGAASGFLHITDGGSWSITHAALQNEPTYQRTFGCGYFEISCQLGSLEVIRTVFAPFGEHPALVTQWRVRNTGSTESSFELRERCFPHPLLVDVEHVSSFTQGLHTAYRFLPYEALHLSAKAQAVGVTIALDSAGKQHVELFLAAMDAETTMNYLPLGSQPSTGTAVEPPVLEAVTSRRLAPGQVLSWRVVCGYAEPEQTEASLAKIRADDLCWLAQSSDKWSQSLPSIEFPDADEIKRELAWGHYYLRSGATIAASISKRTLSQGSIYQYVWGTNASLRDPLQHALPMVYTYPKLARDVLVHTLAQQGPDGELPWGLVGVGSPWTPLHPSDLDLWLLWLAAEYVLATRDRGLLDELISDRAGIQLSVHARLALALDHLIMIVGTGSHDLLRILGGDWNDTIVLSLGTNADRAAQYGESTLNAAIAWFTLSRFAELARYMEDNDLRERSATFALRQRQALRQEWNGTSLTRGWIDQDTPLFEGELFLEPQAWALMGNALPLDQHRALADHLSEVLGHQSPVGTAWRAPFKPSGGTDVWYALNSVLALGYARLDKTLGWKEFRKNTLTAHAAAYPTCWYGVWSGPDSYYSDWGGVQAGKTWSSPVFSPGMIDYPIMNMHAHAQPIWTALQLCGVVPTATGFRIEPHLPHLRFTVRTELLDLDYQPGAIVGRLQRYEEAPMQIEIVEPSTDSWTAIVNGHQVPTDYVQGILRFTIPASSGRVVNWTIRGNTVWLPFLQSTDLAHQS